MLTKPGIVGPATPGRCRRTQAGHKLSTIPLTPSPRKIHCDSDEKDAGLALTSFPGWKDRVPTLCTLERSSTVVQIPRLELGRRILTQYCHTYPLAQVGGGYKILLLFCFFDNFQEKPKPQNTSQSFNFVLKNTR